MHNTRFDQAQHGNADKLGAHYDGHGVNFAVFSRHAEKIDICLFSDDGKTETGRITLPARTGDVHHGYIDGLKPGQVYGILYKDKVEDGAGFLERLGNPYTQVALDPEGRGGLDFGLTGVPETFVISGDGDIILHIGGPLDEALVQKVSGALEAPRS